MLDEAFLPGGDFPCNFLYGVAKASHLVWLHHERNHSRVHGYLVYAVGHSYILVEVLRLSVPNASSRGLDGLQMCNVARSCHNLLLGPYTMRRRGVGLFGRVDDSIAGQGITWWDVTPLECYNL
jgi:hypothetical protein